MRPIDAAGFERMFRRSIDPWNYRASRFEAVKRRALLRACGLRPFGRALELACAIGETSRALSPHALRLLAVDASPTAIDHAREAHGGERLRFALAELPGKMPRGPFDLVVVSELAYYLTPRDLAVLARCVAAALAPGGRAVVLHHLVPFGDAAQRPLLAQRRLIAGLGPRFAPVFRFRTGRYEAVALRARR